MQETSGIGSRIADALRVAAFIKVSDATYRTYIDDQAKIMAAFRKDREGGGKNGRLDVSNRQPSGS